MSLKSVVAAALIVAMIGAGLVTFMEALPAVAATLCASCYGLDRIAPDILMEWNLPQETRQAFMSDVMAARARVSAFYGEFPAHPVIVACATAACDRRLGGRGARAVTYAMPLLTTIRISPSGLNETTVAHEFSHVELHRRVGMIGMMLLESVPAWFDEGVAVLVADDPAYLEPGTTAEQRCKPGAGKSTLPERSSDWARIAGRDPQIYAAASCRVLRWMEANGGRQGLLAALDSVRQGNTALRW